MAFLDQPLHISAYLNAKKALGSETKDDKKMDSFQRRRSSYDISFAMSFKPDNHQNLTVSDTKEISRGLITDSTSGTHTISWSSADKKNTENHDQENNERLKRAFITNTASLAKHKQQPHVTFGFNNNQNDLNSEPPKTLKLAQNLRMTLSPPASKTSLNPDRKCSQEHEKNLSDLIDDHCYENRLDERPSSKKNISKSEPSLHSLDKLRMQKVIANYNKGSSVPSLLTKMLKENETCYNEYAEYSFIGRECLQQKSESIRSLIMFVPVPNGYQRIDIRVTCEGTIKQLVGYTFWQYTKQCIQPPISYPLDEMGVKVVESEIQEGSLFKVLPDPDLPPLKMSENILAASNISTRLVVVRENKLTGKTSIQFVTVKAHDGDTKLPVKTLDMTLEQLYDRIMTKRGLSKNGQVYRLVPVSCESEATNNFESSVKSYTEQDESKLMLQKLRDFETLVFYLHNTNSRPFTDESFKQEGESSQLSEAPKLQPSSSRQSVVIAQCDVYAKRKFGTKKLYLLDVDTFNLTLTSKKGRRVTKFHKTSDIIKCEILTPKTFVLHVVALKNDKEKGKSKDDSSLIVAQTTFNGSRDSPLSLAAQTNIARKGSYSATNHNMLRKGSVAPGPHRMLRRGSVTVHSGQRKPSLSPNLIDLENDIEEPKVVPESHEEWEFETKSSIETTNIVYAIQSILLKLKRTTKRLN